MLSFQLCLDLFLAALQKMQGDVRFTSVLQLDKPRAYLFQLTLGKQPQPIHQR